MPATKTDVQLEHGYTRIVNELYEQIIGCDLTHYQLKVLLAIIRKTYGFQKKVDRIPLGQISSLTKIAKSHVCRAIKDLKNRNIVTSTGNKIGVNKKYKTWLNVTSTGNITSTGNAEAKITSTGNVTPRGNVTESVTTVTSTGNKSLPLQAPQKKERNIQKKYIRSPMATRPEIGKEIKTPRKQIAYPKEIFQDVAAYYVNRRGIRPQGNEWSPIQQAIKTMFMNGRTPQEIKDCIYWLSTHWGSWDIHTVAKRMPEFLAGTLERKKMNPILADALFKRLIGYDSSTDAGYRAELATENALETKYPGWKFAEEWREARMFLQNARKKGGAEENQLLATHPMIADFRQKFLETHAVN